MIDRLSRSLEGIKPSPIRSFGALARSTPGCISLTIGQPDFDTPEVIKQAAKDALDAGLTSYAENNGTLELREAISDYEKRHRGLDYTPEEVLVTIGASGALYTALKGMLDPGDELIVPTPAFNLYETIVSSCCGKFIPLDISSTGFQIDPERLEALVTPRTKGILINTPNNPTGCSLDRRSIEAVRDTALRHDLFVVTDDVYRELVYEEGSYFDIALFRELRDRLIVVQSFSKPYAMTGWRVGYLLADRPVLERLSQLAQCTVSCVSTFSQAACVKALSTDTSYMVESYHRRRDMALAMLEEIGLKAPRPDGAFYLFPNISEFGMSSEEFCRRMITEAGVAAVPGSCFGTEGYIRICYCVSERELREGIRRIGRFVSSLRG